MSSLLSPLLGESIDDPKTLGLLSLAASLSSGKKVMPALAQGLLSRQQIIQDAKTQDARSQMMALQLEQAQRASAQEKALQDAAKASMLSPAQQALSLGGGPTKANATAMQGISGPSFDWSGYASRLASIDPMQALQVQQMTRKDNSPIKLGAGEALLDPKTMKPLYTNPKEDTTPSAVKEYQFAVQQGYKGSFQQFQLEQKRAGASNVSVSMDKGFGDAFAKDAAASLATGRDKAKGAANTLRSIDRAEQALSGPLITGPAQNVRTTLTQLGQVLGVGGKDDAERLSNTRQLMQASAALAVDGAQALAGQGQITDKERELVNRMAGGNLESMTVPEIRQTLKIIKRVNTDTITSHNQNLKKVDPKFSAFTQFYQVDMPKTGGEWSITPVEGK